jgi:multidrug efflux pump
MSMLWVPLSQAIVSGMAFASILTLVATPAMLALPYRVQHRWDRLKALVRRLRGRDLAVANL